MRKTKIIFGYFISLIVLFLTTGCVNKTAITSDEFELKMKERKFNVQDITIRYAEYNYVNKVLTANSKDESYQIEFYDLSNQYDTILFYNNKKSKFEDSKSSTSIQVENNIRNHSKYSLQTNGKYKVISRIGNTVIYVDTDEKYKSEIKNILKELGY